MDEVLHQIGRAAAFYCYRTSHRADDARRDRPLKLHTERVPDSGHALAHAQFFRVAQGRGGKTSALDFYYGEVKRVISNLGAFVDFEGPACSFDSPEFIDLLETVETMPLTGDPLVGDRGYLGQFFLMPGETLLGYPTAAGGTFLFQPDIELAITTAASDPEACWQFVRQFLLEDVQAYTTLADLPVRRDVRDLYALEGYEDGAAAVAAILDGPMTVYRDASRASAVLDIVQDETAAYFAGTVTAEDAAAALQNRVGLYLAEQS